jgi:branched-chain amino acid transport system permease protein
MLTRLKSFAVVSNQLVRRAPVRSFWVRVLLFIGVLALLPLFGNDYITSVFVTIVTYAILGIGLNIVIGQAGLLDLGYAAFFAIGAYTTALLMTKADWNFFYTVPVALAVAGVAGALLGYPTLRLRSDYLAIVTLGFGEMTRIAVTNWDYAGGPDGVWNIPPPVVFGYTVTSQSGFFWMSLPLLATALIFTQHLSQSRIGRGWLALRDDEFAAEAVGLPTLRLKLTAYIVGGLWGGLAGAFFATRIGLINPMSFTFVLSSQVIILIVLGGLGSLPGVLLGSAVMVGLPELFRDFSKYRLLLFAAALILVMLLRPQGLWPHARRKPVPFYGLTQSIPTIDSELSPSDERPELRASRLAQSTPLVLIDGLIQRFGGVTAVDRVSLTIRKGEIFGIIGPNGAGKTTLFNCVTGVQRPKAGTVHFAGAPILGFPPHSIVARGMARTFQGIRLFKQMAVFENVMAGAYVKHRSTALQALLHTAAERADERDTFDTSRRWLSFVGLERHAGKLPTELSYADQRRLEIARALASGPTVVLFDEPAAGMNPTEKLALVAMLRRINQLGTTVVLIDHDMSVVMSVSDRVAVLDQGRLVTVGTPDEVQTNPAVVEAYLGRDNLHESDHTHTNGDIGDSILL